MKYRVRHIAYEYNLEKDEAKTLIERIDKEKQKYYKYVTGKNRSDTEFKNLMIDVNFFRVEETVDLVCSCVRSIYS